jgi:hypothetical protein
VGVHSDLASLFQAGKSVGVHSFLPILKGAAKSAEVHSFCLLYSGSKECAIRFISCACLELLQIIFNGHTSNNASGRN